MTSHSGVFGKYFKSLVVKLTTLIATLGGPFHLLIALVDWATVLYIDDIIKYCQIKYCDIDVGFIANT